MTDPLTELSGLTDTDLGARLLAGVPTNESRSPELLHTLSARAQAFGARIATTGPAGPAPHRVVERDGGLDRDVPTLARFLHRSHTVELFSDSIAFCEDLVDRLGWRGLFPAGSIRAAALLHEHAHHLITDRHARDLRVAVGQPALRVGPLVRWAHVAGAEELAAHAYAAVRLGLGRSPLLITAAASAALTRSAADVSAEEARSWAS